MKINSSFKDYYDFINKYHIVQDNLVYNRDTYVNVSYLNLKYNKLPLYKNLVYLREHGSSMEYEYLNSTYNNHMFYNDYTYKAVEYKHRVISILGNLLYYIEQKYRDKEPFYRILTIEDIKRYLKTIKGIKNIKTYEIVSIYRSFINKQKNIGITDKLKYELYKFHMVIKQPVISYIEVNDNHIDKVYVPNLSKIQGINSILNPYTLYSNIYNFFLDLQDNTHFTPNLLSDSIRLDNINTDINLVKQPTIIRTIRRS